MLRRILIIAVAVAIAPGCSTVKGWFGGKSDGTAQPAELVAIGSPIAVSQLWSVNLGGGEGDRWLRQRPTIGSSRL